MLGHLAIKMDSKLLVRKNILDTDMQKYLQVASVSIIIGFTYLIGVAIAFLTHQINLESFIDMGILGMLSASVLGLAGFFFIDAIVRIKRITKAIQNMEKLI